MSNDSSSSLCDMTHSLCDITHSLCGSNLRNKSQCREALGWQVHCYVSLDSFGTRLCVTWLVRDTFMCEWSISRLCVYESWQVYCYGVALVSKIGKIIGFFCKRALQKSQYSAKKSYNLIDPTNRSPHMCRMTHSWCICDSVLISGIVHDISMCV